MTYDLDTIQKMWVADSKIDIDNLHTESLNIPMPSRAATTATRHHDHGPC